MIKKEIDDLTIVSFTDDPDDPQKPSSELKRWQDVKQTILYALDRYDYSGEFVEAEGHPCWLLEPAQPWRRGRVKVSVEVLIEDKEELSSFHESPLDDIRNLGDS